MSELRIIKNREKLSLYDIKKFFNFEIKEDNEGNKEIYARTTSGIFWLFVTDFTDVKMLRDFIDFVEENDVETELVFTKKCFGDLKHKKEVRWLRWHFELSSIDVERYEKEYQEFLNTLKEKYDFIPKEEELFDFAPYKKRKSLIRKIIEFFSFE